MGSTTSRVAILLATYNGALYIEEQVNSILWQTHGAWHIFVRDDGSTDGTVELLQRRVPAERLTIIPRSVGEGGGPAKNFFSILSQVPLAQFSHVAFCDQDDIWAPRKLERALECLASDGADGYSCNLVPFDVNRQAAWYLRKSQSEKEFDYLFQGASAGCTYVLTGRAAALIQSKVPDIMAAPVAGFSHDWAIYALCRSYGHKWVQDTHAYIFYRQHSSNSFGAMPSYGGLFARLKLARSGWYRRNVLWLGGLLSGSEEERRILAKVQRFSLADRVSLALDAKRFRRTPRDALFFGLVVVAGAM